VIAGEPFGATILASSPVDGSGTATASVALPAGTHSIVAEFTGTLAFADSSSAPHVQTVNQAAISLSVTLSSGTITLGDSVNVTVEADPIAPGGGTVSGTVTASGGGDSDSESLDSNSNAVLTLDSLSAGIHTITVNYPGNANYHPASATAQIVVLPELSITGAQTDVGTENTTVTLTVTLSGPSNQTVRVDFATGDGTATAGEDYVATSGTVEFAPGETSKMIVITILGNATGGEPAESFRVLLSNPQNALIADGEGVIQLATTVQIPTLGTLALMLCALMLSFAGVLVMRR
jgi:fibronectin-binding autotransporter adhesin